MPEPNDLHDVFRPGGSLAVLEPDHAPVRPPAATANQAFPREADIRLAQDLLFFAYRDFTNAADVILEELGLGRAHHRALHFIGRNPGITVSELLAILRITKQSLARVLGALVDQGYVAQAQGDQDRRQRLLTMTSAGQTLERRLFERQQTRLAPAYRAAGAAAVEGFRSVMLGIMDPEACRDITATHATTDAAPPGAPPGMSSDVSPGISPGATNPASPGGGAGAVTSTPSDPPPGTLRRGDMAAEQGQRGDSPTGAARLAPLERSR